MENSRYKFRAWVEGCKVIDVSDLNFYKVNNKQKVQVYSPTFGGRYSININYLMQYTGLKDNNGIEIYEGDVVLFTNTPWNTGGLGSKDKKIIVKYERCGFNVPAYDEDSRLIKDLRVIGNIYENPELLK